METKTFEERQAHIKRLLEDLVVNEELANILDEYGQDSFLLRRYIQDEKDKVNELLSNTTYNGK
jgi:ATP-dependent RNA circularization protein (DNA/RNA ligase family)